MGYDKETAYQPLTGEPFDECVLIEREQRHLLLDDGIHGMPSDEYCEMRDMYIKIVNDLERVKAELCEAWQWISVRDRLPKDGIVVLLHTYRL